MMDDEMAVIDIMAWPVAMMVDRLLMHVDIDDKSKEDIRRKYISEAVELTKKERKTGACKFKDETLNALYGKGGEQELKNVIARLKIGGEVTNVALTDTERAYVASLIMKTYADKYTESKFPQFGVRI